MSYTNLEKIRGLLDQYKGSFMDEHLQRRIALEVAEIVKFSLYQQIATPPKEDLQAIKFTVTNKYAGIFNIGADNLFTAAVVIERYVPLQWVRFRDEYQYPDGATLKLVEGIYLYTPQPINLSF